MADVAQQGHVYRHGGTRVMAMETGAVVRVRALEAGCPWLGMPFIACADELEPLPMRYFKGQVPN